MGAEAARLLSMSGCCEIEPGLTAEEFDLIEDRYGFAFAEDHRAFLSDGLPVRETVDEGFGWDAPWPDWRNGDPETLKNHLEWPVEGLLLLVERHDYWHPGWSERPTDAKAARQLAQELISQAPKLVPVYGSRFIPAGRNTFGNPVISIWNADAICYGTDLLDYVREEFHSHTGDRFPSTYIPFWGDFLPRRP
ncbi:MAG: hypothetical protein HOZ81_44525 [Streptomyces sp.]|nr:hypothetical protein [Streptomyces sp.]NUP44249.1 hypothetical protein [Streptomyces sp.]